MTGASRGLRSVLLGGAVAIAFADSSIVVLALPDLLRRFDASLTEVAWVVTSYNLSVLVAALCLARAWHDPGASARRLTRWGLLLFGAASVACALSPSLWTLVGFRGAQGIGAGALLAGSLPLARGLARDSERGTARWLLAGALGTAIGPAAGGVLTELLGWRAIFGAQAPVAALALVATAGATLPALPAAAPAGRALRRVGANAALALASGALVGALFLVVVLLVDVWGYTPLAAAALVSAIPAGTIAGRLATRHMGLAAACAGGGGTIAAGLAGVALVPASAVGWIAGSLLLCGLGLGLAVPALGHAAFEGSGRPAASATWSIAARHAGLVAGLLLLTPLLAHDLSAATARAERAGTEVVLDSGVPLQTKVPLAADLARTIRRTPHGSLPDFGPDFAARTPGLGAGSLHRLERSLDGTVRAVVTHGFRRAFLLAALLALPLLLALGWARRPRLLAPLALASIALLCAEVAAGGLGYGAAPSRDPCTAQPALPGSGLDPAAQRLVLRGLDQAACHLGKTREQLVLELADRGIRAERWVGRVSAAVRRVTDLLG